MAKTETAIFAGGCFWCLEAVFEEVRGVSAVVSGYIGGNTPNPDYEAICTGRTGHAEAVRLTFDPSVVSYRELLEVFFTIHDPTQLNRQGNDVGTQYRSAIFWLDESQRDMVSALMAEFAANRIFPAPIVTELSAAPHFYPAEDYHQHYFVQHPNQSYCSYVVAPKLDKFRKTLSLLRK
ncbi:MAG: peptide-methionine (S)-S-oxide reductase [Rhodocyclales bacterium]|nr:peptide-methionine (S)-S-oxide reductase [Rhodocyclales bacterium]